MALWEERIYEALSRIKEFAKGKYPRQAILAVAASPSNASGTANINVSLPTMDGKRD